MFIADHQELNPPRMLCPFRGGESHGCMGEQCALWYRANDEDYDACSVFIAAFYACSTSFNTRRLK